MQLCYLLGALENTVVVMDVTTVSGFMRMKYLFFFFLFKYPLITQMRRNRGIRHTFFVSFIAAS